MIRTFLKFKKSVTVETLKQAGYKKHYDSYILKDDKGRFHVKWDGDNVWSIHYDVNTYNGKHMTLPSEYKLQEEKKRIDKFFNIKNNIKNNKANFTCITCSKPCFKHGNCVECKKIKKMKKINNIMPFSKNNLFEELAKANRYLVIKNKMLSTVKKFALFK